MISSFSISDKGLDKSDTPCGIDLVLDLILNDLPVVHVVGGHLLLATVQVFIIPSVIGTEAVAVVVPAVRKNSKPSVPYTHSPTYSSRYSFSICAAAVH